MQTWIQISLQVTRAEWNERFSDVYSVCTSSQDGLDEKLYKETKSFFEQHTKEVFTVSSHCL